MGDRSVLQLLAQSDPAELVEKCLYLTQHSSVFLSSEFRATGSHGKGTFTIPTDALRYFNFVRVVSFTPHHTSNTTPSTAEINGAQSAILLSFPGLLGHGVESCYSVSGRSGHFLIPLPGAVDNEVITLIPNRWFRLNYGHVPSTFSFEISWADPPAGIADEWTLPWHCELHFSQAPWP